jgi:acetyl-CoA acetyltransferase
MARVYVIGAYSTAFGRRIDDSLKDLTREAFSGVVQDAGLEDTGRIETAWFGNCGMWVDGQGSIRGQVCLTPLVRDGSFPERIPVTNVEAGCATASLAFIGAWKDIASGVSEMSVAFGVEKTWYPEAAEKTAAIFDGGIDQYDPSEWQDYYRAAGEKAGLPFEPGEDRTVFMDTYAMQAAYHMKQYGTTQEQIAAGCAKNHTIAQYNERAQYRFPLTVEEVLNDRPISWPLTRSMCAPIGDGAAAAILVSERVLASMADSTRERAVLVAGFGQSGGKYRGLEEDGLSAIAAERAYDAAGIGPGDIDVAEVHDATSFSEIYQSEMLGFCKRGEGGPFVASGATSLGGEIPTNTSGGLVSKGHPVGATGLSMIAQLTEQLRGEAGQRQVEDARIALAENGGGVIGFDEAACCVIILQRSD